MEFQELYLDCPHLLRGKFFLLLRLDSGPCASEASLPWFVVTFCYLSSPTYFQRAIKAGGDSRFDEIKKQPMKFTYFWMAQGLYMR